MQEEDSGPGAVGHQFSKMFDPMEIKSANRTPRGRQWASCGLIAAVCWTFVLNCTKAIAALKSKSEHYLQGKRWKWSRLLPIVGRGDGGGADLPAMYGAILTDAGSQTSIDVDCFSTNAGKERHDTLLQIYGETAEVPASPIYSRLRFASHSGFTGLEEDSSVERAQSSKNLHLPGIASHFSCREQNR